MRRRILGVAVAAVAVAVTLFGVPLAVAVHALRYTEERNELERIALRGAVTVSSDAASGDPIELPAVEPSTHLGIYDGSGALIAGHGPRHGGRAVRAAMHGHVTDATTPDHLVATVPVAADERVVAVARAASPRSAVQRSVLRTWAGMLGVALLAAAAATALAAAQARRVNRPLERLVTLARRLGAGDLHPRAEHSGVDEIDRVGDALSATAEQLDETLRRERAFSAHASHQLRTPLTSLRLGLETALATPGADLEGAARRAADSATRLSRIVDDVLAVARGADGAVAELRVSGMLEEARTTWHGPLAALGRPLRVELDDESLVAAASPAAVRQILDVLLDNAARHGRGAVTLRGRDTEAAVAIDVVDEGSTQGRALLPVDGDGEPTDGGGGRIGLALAQSLTLAQGGRLLHARTEEQTRLTLLLRQPPTSLAARSPDSTAPLR